MRVSVGGAWKACIESKNEFFALRASRLVSGNVSLRFVALFRATRYSVINRLTYAAAPGRRVAQSPDLKKIKSRGDILAFDMLATD